MKKRSKQKSGSASSADKETSAVRIRDLELENESLKRVIVELRTTLNDSKIPVSSPKIAELKKLDTGSYSLALLRCVDVLLLATKYEKRGKPARNSISVSRQDKVF